MRIVAVLLLVLAALYVGSVLKLYWDRWELHRKRRKEFFR